MSVRRTAETLILVLAVTAVIGGLARVAVAFSPLPQEYARLRSGGLAATAKLQSIQAQSTLHAAWLTTRADPLFLEWWGYRRIPWLTGGNYVRALEQRPPERTLGALLGAIVMREADDGLHIQELVMPQDVREMVGSDASAVFELADGTLKRMNLPHPSRDFTWITGVPVRIESYGGLLDAGTADEVRGAVDLRQQAIGVWFAEPSAARSGTWVLTSVESTMTALRREFLVIPLEALPERVAP